jgi:hypothetical protein
MARSASRKRGTGSMALLLAANLAEEAAFGPNPTLPEPTETISRDMAVEKGFRRLGRIRLDETGVRMRRVQTEDM